MKHIRLVSLLMALLCVFACPAVAEEYDPIVSDFSVSELPASNDELFEMYFERELYGMGDVATFGISARSRLTPRQQKLIALYCEEDFSLSEIAAREGISRQGVRDSIKRAEAQMLEMEERLGLARRFRKISSDIEEIYTLAQTIRQYSAFPGCPSEVSDSAARIMVLASMLEKAE